MDDKTRKVISSDFKRACDEMYKLLSGETPNLTVRSQHYLDPTVQGPTVPLNDSRSLFNYYSHLAEGLKFLITEETLPEGNVLPGAPSYVKKLLSNP